MTAIGIVGAGARTALGRSLPASAAAVRARIGRAGPHPFLVDRRNRSLTASRAEWLPIRIDGAARFAVLAANAAKEALARLRGIDEPARIQAFVGLPEARPGRPDDLEDVVTRVLVEGRSFGQRIAGVQCIATGHAAALTALERAAAAIRGGQAELVLAGGVDSYLEPETMDWLEDTERLHNARRPWGFLPGEAAAFCLLASPAWIRAHGARPALALLGAASADEPAPRGSERVSVGLGLSAAFAGALEPLGDTPARIDRLMGDLNGEPHRADELGFAIARVADVLADPRDVLAPAAYWGDVGAASGALFAGLALDAALRGRARGVTTLAWGSSDAGRRAAALLRAIPAEAEAG